MTEKNNDNIILFDMDGTLCDYDKAIVRDYNKLKSPGDPEYAPFKEQIENTSYLKDRIRLIRNQPGWWANLEKYKPGFDVLEIAMELGFAIHILTKGPKSSTNAWAEKVEWVRKNMPDAKDVNITISDDKGLLYGKVLVDDWPEYVERWLENRHRGLVIMPLHPWNRDFKHERVIHYNGKNLNEVRKALELAFKREASEKVNYK